MGCRIAGACLVFTTPALVGGRWIIFATRSTCVMQQSWVGALNPFLIIFFIYGLSVIKMGKHDNQLLCDV